MPLHHILPATFLSSFSDELDGPRRQRRLWVADLPRQRIFQAAAGKVGGINNFYTLPPGAKNPQELEQLWGGYEGGLTDAIDQLICGTISARTWARVLVPFVAAMLVRGPEFNNRHEQLLQPIKHALHHREDNANLARGLELQRLLGPVAAAEWVVVRLARPGEMITNDFGYTRVLDARGRIGMAVPLNPSYVLGVMPRRRGAVLRLHAGQWRPIIGGLTVPEESQRRLGQVLTRFARRLIFGPSETLLHSLLDSWTGEAAPLEPASFGFITGRLAIVHEFAWHRLIEIIEGPSGAERVLSLDIGALAAGWVPRLIIPVSTPVYPTQFRVTEDAVYVQLYDVPGYTVPRLRTNTPS